MARDEFKGWGVVRKLTHDNTGPLFDTKSGQFIVFLSTSAQLVRWLEMREGQP